MADKIEDMGKYARHPRRTAGAAFLMGTALGAGMMVGKMKRNKTPFQKFMDRLSDK
jgi:hypothetical protein